MAGSYRHCLKEDGETFCGFGMLENMKDMAEAVHEMFFMVHKLAEGDRERVAAAIAAYYKVLRGEDAWPAFMGETWRDQSHYNRKTHSALDAHRAARKGTTHVADKAMTEIDTATERREVSTRTLDEQMRISALCDEINRLRAALDLDRRKYIGALENYNECEEQRDAALARLTSARAEALEEVGRLILNFECPRDHSLRLHLHAAVQILASDGGEKL